MSSDEFCEQVIRTYREAEAMKALRFKLQAQNSNCQWFDIKFTTGEEYAVELYNSKAEAEREMKSLIPHFGEVRIVPESQEEEVDFYG